MKEEAGIKINDDLEFITSLSNIDKNGNPTIVLSFLVSGKSGDIILSNDMQDFAWVTAKEAKNYDLIGGLQEELEMAQRMILGEPRGRWQSSS